MASHELPDMNPPAANAAEAAAIAKDAVFWSMHKLAGGPQAPGETVPCPYASSSSQHDARTPPRQLGYWLMRTPLFPACLCAVVSPPTTPRAAGILIFKADAILEKDKEARQRRTVTPGGGYAWPLGHTLAVKSAPSPSRRPLQSSTHGPSHSRPAGLPLHPDTHFSPSPAGTFLTKSLASPSLLLAQPFTRPPPPLPPCAMPHVAGIPAHPRERSSASILLLPSPLLPS
jgi:hypothetical protein